MILPWEHTITCNHAPVRISAGNAHMLGIQILCVELFYTKIASVKIIVVCDVISV